MSTTEPQRVTVWCTKCGVVDYPCKCIKARVEKIRREAAAAQGKPSE